MPLFSPQVIPQGSKNFAFLGQFVEIEDDVVFTVNKIKDEVIKSPQKINWDGVMVEKLDEKTIEQIQTKNKKFIYDILSHIVKLFTLYSNTVSQTKITPELQTSILKYTAGAIYRLISILHEDVEQLQEKINIIVKEN